MQSQSSCPCFARIFDSSISHPILSTSKAAIRLELSNDLGLKSYNLEWFESCYGCAGDCFEPLNYAKLVSLADGKLNWAAFNLTSKDRVSVSEIDNYR